jgi:hypothetical protein
MLYLTLNSLIMHYIIWREKNFILIFIIFILILLIFLCICANENLNSVGGRFERNFNFIGGR